MAAASSDLPRAEDAGERSTRSVTTRIAIASSTVKTRAGAGLPGTAKNVFGTKSRVMVPPGEGFSKNPEPPLTAGCTLNRYSNRYCGAPASHKTKPKAAAVPSIAHLLAHRTSSATGPWISLSATAAPRAAPPHHRPRTHAQSHTPDRPSSTRLT